MTYSLIKYANHVILPAEKYHIVIFHLFREKALKMQILKKKIVFKNLKMSCKVF